MTIPVESGPHPTGDALTAIRERLGRKTVAELQREFNQHLVGLARRLAILAEYARELESRGEDIVGASGRPVGQGLRRLLRMIAGGQVDAEFAGRFVETPHRGTLYTLSLNEQRRLVENPFVPFVQEDGAVRMVDLRNAPYEVLRRIVVGGSLQSVDEQRQSRVLAGLGARREVQYQDETPVELRTERLMIDMSASEAASLRMRARRMGLSLEEFARRLLIIRGGFVGKKNELIS